MKLILFIHYELTDGRHRMARTPLIAGNWKMYKTEKEAVEFIGSLASLVEGCKALVYLSVPFTMISPVAKAAKKTNIVIGAQNMHDASEGAFTGEIAGLMLKSAGAEFVLIGHSERRAIFREDDHFIHRKLIRALKDGLQPILCVGETETEEEEGRRDEVLKRQLSSALAGVSAEDVEKIIVAYEPVWAIGTGKTATPKVAQSAHHFIRKVLEELFNATVSSKMTILYGGSVKPENTQDLMKQKDIDGALVGGASLNSESFSQIINHS